METSGKAKTLSNPEPDLSHELLQLVSFHVGEEEFGLDILRVQEIIRVQQFTRVPNSPDIIDGVINLRGKIIPAISLRKCFGLEDLAPDKQTRIIVVEVKGTVVGFIVDAVSEVLRIAPSTIEPPPRLGRVHKEYVFGVGKINERLVILLDIESLIADSEKLNAISVA